MLEFRSEIEKQKTCDGIKTDCFAFDTVRGRKACRALTALYCEREKCSFYKTVEQFEKEKSEYL